MPEIFGSNPGLLTVHVDYLLKLNSEYKGLKDRKFYKYL